MPRGHLFTATPSDVIDALKYNYGVVTHAAQQLGVCKETLYDIIRNNIDIQQELDRIRNRNDEEILDMSEDSVRHALSLKASQPKLALQAAIAVLDRKGHKRNWVQNQIIDTTVRIEHVDPCGDDSTTP